MTTAEAIDKLADGVFALRSTVYPTGVLHGTDAAGGHIESLTESVMGVTSGLFRIAEAIDNLAEAVRDGQRPERDDS